jgi:hypothetical protein
MHTTGIALYHMDYDSRQSDYYFSRRVTTRAGSGATRFALVLKPDLGFSKHHLSGLFQRVLAGRLRNLILGKAKSPAVKAVRAKIQGGGSSEAGAND